MYVLCMCMCMCVAMLSFVFVLMIGMHMGCCGVGVCCSDGWCLELEICMLVC
jgi:hypothetical protein